MEKISDKNLICILLTAGLAILTIGNAFHAGNWVLGFETLFMWAVLYSFQPLSRIIDEKIVCPTARIDCLPFFKQTVDNRYLFISFCAALLLSMIFDDTLNYLGRFVEDIEIFDLLAVCTVIFAGALISFSFYYLLAKIRIERLKNNGEKAEVLVEKVRFLNNKCYVISKVVNPVTGKKQRLIGKTYASSRSEIPLKLTVYFDKKNPEEYFFDTYFEKEE